jgi:hypothetical protein
LRFTPIHRYKLFDGNTGTKVKTVRGVALNAQRWLQIDSILAQNAPNVGQINMPCVYMDEYGTDIPAKTEGVRKFVKGQLVPIGPGGGFFTLANEILREGPVLVFADRRLDSGGSSRKGFRPS